MFVGAGENSAGYSRGGFLQELLEIISVILNLFFSLFFECSTFSTGIISTIKFIYSLPDDGSSLYLQ